MSKQADCKETERVDTTNKKELFTLETCLHATKGLCAGVALGLMYELKEVSAKRITLISKISFKLKTKTS